MSRKSIHASDAATRRHAEESERFRERWPDHVSADPCISPHLVLLRSADLVHAAAVRHVRRAYPVPTHDRDSIVRQAKVWLGERGIFSVGRFGEWTYINSDEALLRGLQLGRCLRALNEAAAGCGSADFGRHHENCGDRLRSR